MNSSPLLFLWKCISFIHKLYDCSESLREEVAELGSWGAFVYVCTGPVFSFQMPFSRAKVREPVGQRYCLDVSRSMGLFIRKTQLPEVFIHKPHLLKLRNLMMRNTSIDVLCV